MLACWCLSQGRGQEPHSVILLHAQDSKGQSVCFGSLGGSSSLNKCERLVDTAAHGPLGWEPCAVPHGFSFSGG